MSTVVGLFLGIAIAAYSFDSVYINNTWLTGDCMLACCSTHACSALMTCACTAMFECVFYHHNCLC